MLICTRGCENFSEYYCLFTLDKYIKNQFIQYAAINMWMILNYKIGTVLRNYRHHIVAEIVSASYDKSEGIGQVNQAVTSMDDLTRQHAALAEEASAASVSMTENRMKGSSEWASLTCGSVVVCYPSIF